MNNCLEHCPEIQTQFTQKHIVNWNLLTIYHLPDNVLNNDYVELNEQGGGVVVVG